MKLKDFCLAIQSHEGWFSGSRSFRNNNPGNLRAGDKGWGIDDKKFTKFPNYEYGFQSLKDDILYKCALSKRLGPEATILQLFEVYAPSADSNNPTIYAKFVASKVGVNINTKLKNIMPKYTFWVTKDYRKEELVKILSSVSDWFNSYGFDVNFSYNSTGNDYGRIKVDEQSEAGGSCDTEDLLKNKGYDMWFHFGALVNASYFTSLTMCYTEIIKHEILHCLFADAKIRGISDIHKFPEAVATTDGTPFMSCVHNDFTIKFLIENTKGVVDLLHLVRQKGQKDTYYVGIDGFKRRIASGKTFKDMFSAGIIGDWGTVEEVDDISKYPDPIVGGKTLVIYDEE